MHKHTHTYRQSERQPRRPSFLLCRCLAPALEFIIHFRWYPLISCATRHWPIDGVSLITFRSCHLLVLSHTALFFESLSPFLLFLLFPFLRLLLSVFSFCLSAAHWRQLICASLCLSLLINAPGSCFCCYCCFFFLSCFLFLFFYFLLLLFSLLCRTFLRRCIACQISMSFARFSRNELNSFLCPESFCYGK